MPAILGMVAVLGGAGCRAGHGEIPPKDLVLIVVDTLRRDRLSAYGYERGTSPILDQVAAEGARADGLSPTSWTKPATASLLTGLHPLRHQAYGRDDVLVEQAVTLAEMLGNQGYQTVGISSNGWVSDRFGLAQGFSRFSLMEDLGYAGVASAEQVNAELLPLLSELRSPFFLYVHYVDPHPPYDPPTAWDGSPLDPTTAARSPLHIDQLNPLTFGGRSDADVEIASDLYDGEVRAVDGEIGRLRQALHDRGLDESLLTVITSDHGEEFADHGRMGHGHSVYGEVTDVPLIFHAPGTVRRGARLGRFSLIDVLPTILDLLQVEGEAPYELDGSSRADLLRGGRARVGKRHLVHLDVDDGRALALIDGDDKAVVGKFPYLKEVYDLRRDPREREPSRPGRLSAAAAELFSELAQEHNRLAAAALPRQVQAIDEKTAEGLRALGYLAGGRQQELRYIPRRIRPADGSSDGLLGWENVEQPPSCLDMEDDRAGYQLLDGWYLREQEGRWTAPHASLLLGAPPAADRVRLMLRGVNHRGEPFDLRASADDRQLLALSIAAGVFEVRSRPWVPASRMALVRLDASPAFVPAEHGSLDFRNLGAFVSAVCLEPAPAGLPGDLAAAASSHRRAPWLLGAVLRGPALAASVAGEAGCFFPGRCRPTDPTTRRRRRP